MSTRRHNVFSFEAGKVQRRERELERIADCQVQCEEIEEAIKTLDLLLQFREDDERFAKRPGNFLFLGGAASK